MAEDEDWLFRPVLRGHLALHALFDCSVSLEHVALVNEAIDVSDENQRRFERAQARKAGST